MSVVALCFQRESFQSESWNREPSPKLVFRRQGALGEGRDPGDGGGPEFPRENPKQLKELQPFVFSHRVLSGRRCFRAPGTARKS